MQLCLQIHRETSILQYPIVQRVHRPWLRIHQCYARGGLPGHQHYWCLSHWLIGYLPKGRMACYLQLMQYHVVGSLALINSPPFLGLQLQRKRQLLSEISLENSQTPIIISKINGKLLVPDPILSYYNIITAYFPKQKRRPLFNLIFKNHWIAFSNSCRIIQRCQDHSAIL